MGRGKCFWDEGIGNKPETPAAHADLHQGTSAPRAPTLPEDPEDPQLCQYLGGCPPGRAGETSLPCAPRSGPSLLTLVDMVVTVFMFWAFLPLSVSSAALFSSSVIQSLASFCVLLNSSSVVFSLVMSLFSSLTSV